MIDNALGWTFLAVALVAAIILDKGSAPHNKWHTAILWTLSAFFGVLIFGRQNRGSLLFWLFWTACLGLHVFAMWLTFAQLLPHLSLLALYVVRILGVFFVIPIAFIESIFLVGMFAKLEHKLAPAHHEGAD